MGGRCSGWASEELIVRAINSDTIEQHHASWREAGHDDQADIRVRTGGSQHSIQVKSGTITKTHLTLSGHRLGRLSKSRDLLEITKYLNAPKANFVSVPCKKQNDECGRRFTYWLCYIEKEKFTGLRADKWDEHNKQYRQMNQYGVRFRLSPSMSWQIWWDVPLDVITEKTEPFTVG